MQQKFLLTRAKRTPDPMTAFKSVLDPRAEPPGASLARLLFRINLA